jgi:hypothetical protein
MLSKRNDLRFEAGKNQSVVEEEKDSEDPNLFIWKVNPSLKDINNKESMKKTIPVVALVVFLISFTYLFTFNLLYSLGVGSIILLMFLISFHDQFFCLQSLFSYAFRKFISFNPFEKLSFWQEKEDRSILFITNRQDATHIGLRMFKIEVLPENVHAALQSFIRLLSEGSELTSYTYQVVQHPFYAKRSMSKDNAVSSLESMETFIYFSVYDQVKGILRENKRELLKYKLNVLTNRLKAGFIANFHHYRIALLAGTHLLNALRTHFIKDIELPQAKEIKYESYLIDKVPSFSIAKLLFCSLLIVICDYLLVVNMIHLGYILFCNLFLVLVIGYLWWRELLFQLSKKQLFYNDKIELIAPFKDVEFFHFKHLPDSIFLLVNHQLLINHKMLNLNYAASPPYGSADHFYQAIVNQRLPFVFTAINTPLAFYQFYKEGLKYLTNEELDRLVYEEKTRLRRTQDEFDWLNKRYGIWRTILLVSTSRYKLVDSLKVSDVQELEEQLRSDIQLLKSTFQMNFLNYKVVELQKRKLVSGYICEVIKNKLSRLQGTHLNYVVFQGKFFITLMRIVDMFKKGIETRIAAEFNTPLHLKNNITIGYTINTEILEDEIPFGFLEDQVNNLLITNGTAQSRDLASMKIVAELVKAKIPSIIFDFNGSWSRLIRYFKESRYELDLLHFKLGSTFTLDPLHSDIPYDQNNPAFLEYIYDSYALAFKKDERTIEMFRSTIQRNPDRDLPSLNLELMNQKEWDKRPMDSALVNLFSDFTQEDLSRFFSSQKGSSDIVNPLDFIGNKKTIIIDLSLANDFNRQLFFSFIIISKFLHSAKQSQDYIPKILVIPYIDLFFDNSYIDHRTNYSIIDTFLEPLKQYNFGMICSANQIHYLHSNFLKYFNNYLTFQANDSRDIAVLKNQMNLQELVGRGYYSSSRNNTYQIDYLMNLRGDEIIVKRDGIYQPFPGRMVWDDLKDIPRLSPTEILSFMKGQGYDLKASEEQILQQAETTIFQMDLSSYIIYLEEIMNFLEHLKTIDQIGNLYKKSITEELKKYIAPKAKQRNYRNTDIVNLVAKLFELLVKHGYLVENHPKRAGGSEAMRTSYSVGERFDTAVEDFYRSQAEIVVDVVEQATDQPVDYEKVLKTPERDYVIKKEDLQEAFAREISTLSYDIYKIFKFINHGEYKNALKLEHNLIRQFIMRVYQHFYSVNYIITANDLKKFIQMIATDPDMPFTAEELMEFMEKYQTINFDAMDVEGLAKEIYYFYAEFFQAIQEYTYHNETRG